MFDFQVELKASSVLGLVYVSRKSHSLPITHLIALSFPLSMPHSKSVQGPRFSVPISSSVFGAGARALSHTVSIVMLCRHFGISFSHSSPVTSRCLPRSMEMRRFQCRLYQTKRN